MKGLWRSSRCKPLYHWERQVPLVIRTLKHKTFLLNSVKLLSAKGTAHQKVTCKMWEILNSKKLSSKLGSDLLNKIRNVVYTLYIHRICSIYKLICSYELLKIQKLQIEMMQRNESCKTLFICHRNYVIFWVMYRSSFWLDLIVVSSLKIQSQFLLHASGAEGHYLCAKSLKYRKN